MHTITSAFPDLKQTRRESGSAQPNDRAMEEATTSADGVTAARRAHQRGGGGAIPTSALHPPTTYAAKQIVLTPVPGQVAKGICEAKHYLHSYPGASLLNFGIFVEARLLGAAVIGCGPPNVHRLFSGAAQEEVACLTRLWLDDRLGKNAESRTLGIILRSLRNHQSTIKALIAYSDPAAGHTGTIYRAAGFVFIGSSDQTAQYRLGRRVMHSRTPSHRLGTRASSFFADHGVALDRVPVAAKLTYAAFVNPHWSSRLQRPAQPYYKQEGRDGNR